MWRQCLTDRIPTEWTVSYGSIGEAATRRPLCRPQLWSFVRC